MPGNIEFLSLTGSGIKELPSSVWSHEKVSSLDITYCRELKELPSSSCKLKVSGAFSLKFCFSLEKFWELPSGIDELDFSSTKIEVLPTSSMECLFRLTRLKLKGLQKSCEPPTEHFGCFTLKVVPSNIYKLTNLKKLNFFKCWELQNFPQPAGPGGLLSLEVLELGCSGILEIPECLICSTSLRGIDLTQSQIRSIPMHWVHCESQFRVALAHGIMPALVFNSPFKCGRGSTPAIWIEPWRRANTDVHK
ncbi:hypothetical protein DVH24_034642 [Malus domestica]|uniref:Uncharacterized protein n=1 Tax=Malus domestica TaxID=3750 RepID=A0A498J192_MALDO|nr:hypothetical protein DVH24_034642 [Malus domestica]